MHKKAEGLSRQYGIYTNKFETLIIYTNPKRLIYQKKKMKSKKQLKGWCVLLHHKYEVDSQLRTKRISIYDGFRWASTL